MTAAERQRHYRQRRAAPLSARFARVHAELDGLRHVAECANDKAAAEAARDIVAQAQALLREAEQMLTPKTRILGMTTLSSGFAGEIDDLMALGMEWDRLVPLAKDVAKRLGINPIMATLSRLKAHARWRAAHDGWQVKITDKGVWLRIPFPKP
jgi:hypothetical protein